MKPEELLYTKDHEWIEKNADGPARIGITEYAANELGDIVYVELPEVGDEFDEGDAFGNVESVKAVSPLNMPIAGKIAAVNEGLEDAPELVNQSPLDEGWMVKLEITGALDGLMELAQYKEFLNSQSS